LGKELKRILNKCGHICSGVVKELKRNPTSTSSVFSFFPILKVEENVCNALQQCRPLFFGGFPNPSRRKKKMGDFPQEEVGDFQDDCATVWHLCNWGCSKVSTENKSVNRNSDKQSARVNLQP